MSQRTEPVVDPLVGDYLALMDDSAVAVLPHALRIAAELGVPEALAAGPSTVDELAARVGADRDALTRLLRALASVGFFAEDDHAFALTPLGERLLPGTSGGVAESLHNLESFRAWHDGAASVRSGRSVFAGVHGDDFFGHKDVSTRSNDAFLRRMRERAGRLYPRLPGAVDWQRTAVLMDVGGGDGFLLTEILRHAPHLTGVLFDRAPVVDVVAKAGTVSAFPHRLRLETGDFFTAITPGADTHLLCSVLHDWTDEQVVAILRNCRRALAPGGRVLIVEMLVPEGHDPHPSKWSDLGMMILTGGRERTRAEFADLLARAGFGEPAVRPIADSFFSVLEAT